MTILIAEDEPDIRAMLGDYLTGEGYDVMEAATGREAVVRAGQGPDLILLDVGLPDMDGLEVCRLLRDHLPCPILFLTARVEEADRLQGFAAGGDDYILKPFSLRELGALQGLTRAPAGSMMGGKTTAESTGRSTCSAKPIRSARSGNTNTSSSSRRSGGKSCSAATGSA